MPTVTYSAEDDKLRLYVGRVPKDEYQRLRKAGFVATPKQDCDFAAVWTPSREDLASEYLDDDEDIGDEDYSPLERAADRAERFGGYREKRADEAGGHADSFEAGPSAFGHQNQARAERQASRHDRERVRAVSQWSKAEYWQRRTEGVISNALHKADPRVRRGRILTLEKELRSCEAAYTPHDDKTFMQHSHNAKYLGNGEYDRAPEPHVFVGPKGRGCYPVAVSSLEGIKQGQQRVIEHLNLRLIYENLMLANEGGKVSEVEIEPGGWFGRHQVQKVSKSNTTGRVVSIHILAPSSNNYDRKGNPYNEDNPRPMTLHKINIERFGEDAYRPPTDEERTAFAATTKAAKAKAKATAPKAPPLINPTDEDAERLQALWNERERIKHVAKYGENCSYSEFKPQEVLRLTQAQYSANSKGAYARFETVNVTEFLETRRGRTVVFKIRKRSAGDFYRADIVVVITDKPQKPIPWDAVDAARDEQPTEESLRPKLDELQAALALNWLPKDDEAAKLIGDARYVGWAFVSSMSQFGWTDEGIKAYRQWEASKQKLNAPMRATKDGTRIIDAVACDNARSAGMLF